MTAWEPRKMTVVTLPNPPNLGGGNIVGVGASVDVSQLRDLAIQLEGNLNGTLIIEGSLTGGVADLEWSAVCLNGSDFTANWTTTCFNGSTVPTTPYLRVRVTVWNSGTPAVKVSGGVR